MQKQALVMRTQRCFRAGSIRLYAICLTLCALAFSHFAFSQSVNIIRELIISPPTEDHPIGSYVRARTDAAAHITDSAGREVAGRIIAKGSQEPDEKANAFKLRQVGYVAAPDNPSDPNGPKTAAVGAQWDYDHVIRSRIKNIEYYIPDGAATPESWPLKDQELHEMGRPALPFIKARMQMEGNTARDLQHWFVRAAMMTVVDETPKGVANDPSILQIPSEHPPHQPYGPPGTTALAAYRLGPSAIAHLDEIEAELSKAEQLTQDKKVWIDFLKGQLKVLEKGIALAFSGGEIKGAKFNGLQRGDVIDRGNFELWPIPEQLLVNVFRLGALHSVESLGATFYDYATKADWMAKKIRELAAEQLFQDLEILSAAGELGKPDSNGNFGNDNYFGNPGTPKDELYPYKGVKNLHDFLVMLICQHEVATIVDNEDAIAGNLLLSEFSHIRLQGQIKRRVVKFLKWAMKKHNDEQPALPVKDRVDALRSEPAKFRENLKAINRDFSRLPHYQLGMLEAQRVIAIRYQTKFAWHYEQIRAKDQRAASNLFESKSKDHAAANELDLRASDLVQLRKAGRVVIDADWIQARRIPNDTVQRLIQSGVLVPAGQSSSGTVFHYYGDPNYRALYRLSEENYQKLVEKGEISVVDREAPFQGDTENSGSIYDYQKDVSRKGLSIDFLPPEDESWLFRLIPGRSYEFSFDYYAEGMRGVSSWVQFVPLNELGKPLTRPFVPDDADDEIEEGRIIPFRFATDRSDVDIQGQKLTGSTYGAWRSYKVKIHDVPDRVHGFTIQIKVDALLGTGRFFYRNFKLSLQETSFKEDFEHKNFGEHSVADAVGVGKEEFLPSQTWQQIVDPDNGYLPYSRLSYNALVTKNQNNNMEGGRRSLLIEPNGTNVRLETNKFFELKHQNGYVFRGLIMAENMATMRAYYELLLYNEKRQPVSIDGIPVNEGENVIRTPMRGDSAASVAWQPVAVYDGWYSEEIQLDHRRTPQVAKRFHRDLLLRLPERSNIAYARIAIVVKGPKPAYSAKVYVDNVELKEYPKVTLTLGRRIAPEFQEDSLIGDFDNWDNEIYPRHLVRYFPPDDGRPTRRYLSFNVEGLVPERIGYRYSLRIMRYTGAVIPAADSIGSEKLDKVVLSDRNGKLRAKTNIPLIYFDEIGLKDDYGYFQAEFELGYAGDSEPLVKRSFPFGFVPPPLSGEIDPGDLGIVIDRNSFMQQGVLSTIIMSGAGRLAVELFDREGNAHPDAYASQRWIKDTRRMLRLLPKVRKSGIMDPIPDFLLAATSESGASAVFSNNQRSDWKDVMYSVLDTWDDTFDTYKIGALDEESYTDFSGQPARALDNLEGVFKDKKQGWAPRELPFVLAKDDLLLDRVDALVKSFRHRWRSGLDSMDQSSQDAIRAAMTAEEIQDLRDSLPELFWLKDYEQMSFYVPEDLSAADMKVGIEKVLEKIGRFRNILGDDQQTALSNAKTLASRNGNVDFTPLAQDLRRTIQHSMIIDLKPVNPRQGVNYVTQLRDFTEKVVTAREMGFDRILVSRLRNRGDLPDGLLTRTNDPQPAFFAFRTLNSLISRRERLPLALDLKSGVKNSLFRTRDGKYLTYIIFPGEDDIVEDLPLGTRVKRVDLMGNLVDIRALKEGDGPGSEATPTGMVRVSIPKGGTPLILTGISTDLMETVLSINLDDPIINAAVTDQKRTLSVTNRFDVPAAISIKIPLVRDPDDITNVAYDSRFKFADGRELPARAPAFYFDTVELAPGESRTFDFILQPMASMGTGQRVIPLEIDIKAKETYSITHRMSIETKSKLNIPGGSLLNPPNKPVVDILFTVENNTNVDRRLNAVLSFPKIEGRRPLTKVVGVSANGSVKVPIAVPERVGQSYEGEIVYISLRETPGALFYNQYFKVEAHPLTGSLTLVPISANEVR